ncbi:histone H1 protein [Haloferula helveola]|uniref:Histone H1 protein n=1 Tax=Haloferula helveola TaxID=490095 RepID=A0ABN6H607_9BACT|nr:histone H1 protein [Haloferula helveola]
MKLSRTLRGGAVAAFLVSFSPLHAVEPVIAPDDGTGSIAFPVLNAPFGNSTRVRKGMQELKTLSGGIRVEIQSLRCTAVTSSGPGGNLGGGRQTCDGTAVVVFENDSGLHHVVSVPVTVVTDTAAGSPGADNQDYDCDMVRLEGQLFGDPDFDLLRIEGGSEFGLPSPGRTTLTRLGPPGSDFAVDSFFDIEYRIDFQGAPGGAIPPTGGQVTESARCEQPLKMANGVPFEVTGDVRAVRAPDGIRVSGVGGGGGGGVIRLGAPALDPIYDELHWSYLASPTSNGLELPTDGDSLALAVHVRDLEINKFYKYKIEAACTNVGGNVEVTPDFSPLGAVGTQVQVWHDGRLVGSAFAPAGTVACSVPARDFQLRDVTVCRTPIYGATVQTAARQCRAGTPGDLVFVKELDKSSPKLCSTPGGDFLGSELRFVPVGATLRCDTIGHVDHGSSVSCVIDDNSVRIYDREGSPPRLRALGGGGLSKADSKRALEGLRVSNLGSSGQDGVSVDLGDDGRPPVRVEIEEIFTYQPTGGGSGGSIWLNARDAFGNPLGQLRLSDSSGSGGGGRVALADFSSVGSPTALVRVYQDDALVGEGTVGLGGLTPVAEIDDVPGEASLITACGKNELAPPFQLPCFFAEFDRPVLITPTGLPGPFTGNRIEILANAVSGTPNPLRFFEILTDETSDLILGEVSHISEQQPVWVWATGAPVFPPTLHTICPVTAKFDTSSGGGLPPGSEGLEFRVQISDLVDLGPDPAGGAGNLFDCTVEIAAQGLGGKKGYDYYKALGARCVIDTGTNPFAGKDVQQFDTEMVSLELTIVGDPDFDLLRIQCGSGLGLTPCPGQVTRTRLPSGNFNVDSFFDIEYRIDFQGGPGSPFAGVAGGDTFNSRWYMYQPQFIRWGLVHEERGGAVFGRSPTGGLTVSNLGSSGQDGVSIDLAGAHGGTVEWEPLAILPGGSIRVTTTGDASNSPHSSVNFDITVQRHAVDSFFDITYDCSALAPATTAVQVYNGPILVGEVPGADIGSLQAASTQPGIDPPPVVACSTYRSSGGGGGAIYIGPCQSVSFASPVSVTAGGGGPLVGDQVRLVCTGVELGRLSRITCGVANVPACEIRRTSVIMHGRLLSCDDGSVFRCWDGTCRLSVIGCPNDRPFRCVDGTCQISRNACPAATWPDNEISAVVSPRDAASGLATGKRQHRPLSVSVSGALMAHPGDTFRVSTSGTAGGLPNQSIGELEVVHDGFQLLTSVQWPYKLSAQTRVQIRETPLHEESGNTGSSPLYEGVAPPGGSPVLVDGAAPVVISTFGAAPSPGNPLNRPAYLNFSFVDPVLVIAPDGLPYLAREVILIPEDPALPEVGDLNDVTARFTGRTGLSVDEIFTGPHWSTGLSHRSRGSADLRDGVLDGSDGLVVSNLGSSGQDGVSIDLQEGEGVRVEFEPIELADPSSVLRCGVMEDLAGTSDEDRNDVVLRYNGHCSVSPESPPIVVRVVCRDSFGNAVGDFSLPSDDLGVCTPTVGPFLSVSECGWNPPLVTSLGATDPGPYLRFSEPVSFAASSGVSVQCSSLHIHCGDAVCVQYRETDWDFLITASNLPDVKIISTHVCHFRGHPHLGLGQARLKPGASPDQLVISNIGSSGQDGVSIDLEHAASFSTGGSGGEDKLTENVSLNFQPIPIRLNVPGGGGPNAGRITMDASGSFDPNGGPGVPLGTCAIDVDSDGDSVPIEVDFSALGVPNARVVVLQDGQFVGEFIHGDPVHPVVVGRVRSAGGPVVLTGCGYHASRGSQGAHWSDIWEVPIDCIPPGAAPGSGFVGNQILIYPEGDAVSVVPQTAGTYQFDLTVRDNPSLSSLPSLVMTGLPKNDFITWLQLHFTPAEIEVMASQNFQGDFDGDGCPDVCEFIEGTDPRVPDNTAGQGVAFSTVAGPPGSELIRLVYHTADVEGADVILRSTSDLQIWNEDPSQFRLISNNLQPDGRWRWEWEVLAPLGSQTRAFYGHVTVLK